MLLPLKHFKSQLINLQYIEENKNKNFDKSSEDKNSPYCTASAEDPAKP